MLDVSEIGPPLYLSGEEGARLQPGGAAVANGAAAGRAVPGQWDGHEPVIPAAGGDPPDANVGIEELSGAVQRADGCEEEEPAGGSAPSVAQVWQDWRLPLAAQALGSASGAGPRSPVVGEVGAVAACQPERSRMPCQPERVVAPGAGRTKTAVRARDAELAALKVKREPAAAASKEKRAAEVKARTLEATEFAGDRAGYKHLGSDEPQAPKGLAVTTVGRTASLVDEGPRAGAQATPAIVEAAGDSASGRVGAAVIPARGVFGSTVCLVPGPAWSFGGLLLEAGEMAAFMMRVGAATQRLCPARRAGARAILRIAAREPTEGEAAQSGLSPRASACEAGDGPEGSRAALLLRLRWARGGAAPAPGDGAEDLLQLHGRPASPPVRPPPRAEQGGAPAPAAGPISSGDRGQARALAPPPPTWEPEREGVTTDGGPPTSTEGPSPPPPPPSRGARSAADDLQAPRREAPIGTTASSGAGGPCWGATLAALCEAEAEVTYLRDEVLRLRANAAARAGRGVEVDFLTAYRSLEEWARACREAENYVMVACFTLDHPAVVAYLEEVRARGVVVRVLYSGRGEAGTLLQAPRLRRLRACGCEVRAHVGAPLHAKVMLTEQVVVLGSGNRTAAGEAHSERGVSLRGLPEQQLREQKEWFERLFEAAGPFEFWA